MRGAFCFAIALRRMDNMYARVLESPNSDSKNLLIFADYKMRNDSGVNFGPFCLDFAAECLWKGSRAIKLRPKAFAVLDYLVSRPGQLVTKEELLNEVWPGTFVGEAVLKVAIRQIREALDDDPGSPRFIETAHRRGYRFIGEIKKGDRAPVKDRESRAMRQINSGVS